MCVRRLVAGAVAAGGGTLALVGCGGSGGSGTVGPVVITATPSVGLFDQARTIVVSHLRPGERITVEANTARVNGTWTSSATFRASHDGVVNLAREAPTSGSYHVANAMGLLWSERLRMRGPPPLAHGAVTTLTVHAGGRALASTQVTQRIRGPGVTVRMTTLAADGFVGAYYRPRGGGQRPAAVIWGGSEGGDAGTEATAELLASHGTPALAVAYFDEPGLPCALQNIPLEYFVRAIRWLRAQPQVDPSRVWIHSGSRGTEAEMLVAGHWPGLVHGLVAEAPADFPNGPYHGTCQPKDANTAVGAWTLHGRPVSVSEPLPVARFRGPVLLVTGGQDAVWPSELQADQLMMALPHDGAAHVHLNYPAAGHEVLGVPSYPAPPAQDGGTAAANEAAYASDWPAMLRFTAGH
jgi:dienelactone hydrolase